MLICQINKLRIELYAAPGLFIEHLSNNNLVIPSRKNLWPLGDVESYAIQLVAPLKNKRLTIKAGVGFSQRHYSINKNTITLFGKNLITDSFDIRKVRFTNNYLQVPLSFAYTVTKPNRNFQLGVGLQFSQNFLIHNNTIVHFDSTYKTPTQTEIINAQKQYSANISKLFFVAQPYLENIFYTNKKIGFLIQIAFPSYYGTRLDKKLTTSTIELIGFKFGAFYSFGK